MRRTAITATTLLLVVTVIAVVFVMRAPSMLNSAMDMYPVAPPMPAAASKPVEELIASYEGFLKTKAPSVLSSLQPGLTDSELDALESQHTLKLTPDLRALYRWRNGTAPGSNLSAFPDHRFVPLDVALSERDLVRKQAKSRSLAQRKAYEALAQHRDAWVGLIMDPAGDGHFFDPNRLESQGSFFFCFAEDGSYVFFPAFRNYLAAVLDGINANVFVVGPRGVETTNFVKAQGLWESYGAAPKRP